MEKSLILLTVTVLLVAACEGHGDKWRKRGGHRGKHEGGWDKSSKKYVTCPRDTTAGCPSCLTCLSPRTCMLKDNYCYIDGVCYGDGARSSYDVFQYCNSNKNYTEWDEQYGEMEKEGVILEMENSDKVKLENNMKGACDALAMETNHYCSEKPEKCSRFMCDFVGAYKTTLNEVIPLEFSKCWLEKEDDDEWRLFAKMSQSRADFEQMCFGGAFDASQDDIHWLLPPCIMYKVTKEAKDKWEVEYGVEIEDVDSVCNSGFKRICKMAVGAAALLVFVVIVIVTVACCIKKNRMRRLSSSAVAETGPAEPNAETKAPISILEPPTYMEATAPPPAYDPTALNNPLYDIPDEKKQAIV